MFKEKKINENAVKKDFFKIDKKINNCEKIYINSQSENYNFLQTNDLEKIKLPQIDEVLFLTTKNARSLVNFVLNIDPDECYLFCSRFNEKSFNIIKNKNLKGIGLSERVLQNNPDFYKKVTKETIIKLNNNHSKMLLFLIKNNYYVICGSGNASINSRIENYIVENNKEKYLQIKNFFENA